MFMTLLGMLHAANIRNQFGKQILEGTSVSLLISSFGPTRIQTKRKEKNGE